MDRLAGAQGIGWIVPEWPAPACVRALSTLRGGGASRVPYESLNLAVHVGDDPQAVRQNREDLRAAADLPAEPHWLSQVHGVTVIEADPSRAGVAADAAWTAASHVVCGVLTADCLPLLLCDREGARVAAVHAGWRGLAAGVIEAAVAALRIPGEHVMAWLGPAIGPSVFEVGAEVRERFVTADATAAAAFRASAPDHWYADLYALARLRLAACGVPSVSGGHWCTHSDPGRFFSYRRDGITGRMATLIWRT